MNIWNREVFHPLTDLSFNNNLINKANNLFIQTIYKDVEQIYNGSLKIQLKPGEVQEIKNKFRILEENLYSGGLDEKMNYFGDYRTLIENEVYDFDFQANYFIEQ